MHSIWLVDCSIATSSCWGPLQMTHLASRSLLFRHSDNDLDLCQNESTIALSTPKCVVLGLPTELSEEDLALFLEPYISEILSVKIIINSAVNSDSSQFELLETAAAATGTATVTATVTATATANLSTSSAASNQILGKSETSLKTGDTKKQQGVILNSIDTAGSSKIAIIAFCSEDSLREFSSLYNNLHFPNFRNVPPCVVIPIRHCDPIISSNSYPSAEGRDILAKNERQVLGLQIKESNLFPDRHDETSLISAQISSGCVELPTCTVCLRRLQSSVSGVEGGNDVPVSMRFRGNTGRCAACRVYGAAIETGTNGGRKEESQLQHCLTCGLWGNIWACLVCGHTGCGRYAMRHAEHHFTETKHAFSLELATGRIWDYKRDTFVHVEGEWGRSRELEEENSRRRENLDSRDRGASSPCASSSASAVSKGYEGDTGKGNKGRDTQFSGLLSKGGAGKTCSVSDSSRNSRGEEEGEKGEYSSGYDFDYMSMTGGEDSGERSGALDSVVVDKMGCLVERYENLLESQLADQQIYFEKKLARETILLLEESMRRENRENLRPSFQLSSSGSGSSVIDSKKSSPCDLKKNNSSDSSSYENDLESIDAQLAGVGEIKIEISALEQQYCLALSALQEMEAQGRAIRKQNDTLIREQKKQKDRVAELGRCEEETKSRCEEEVGELEQQIRDLSFYTKTKCQVASSHLKEELEGGSVLVPIPVNLEDMGNSSGGGKRRNQQGQLKERDRKSKQILNESIY